MRDSITLWFGAFTFAIGFICGHFLSIRDREIRERDSCHGHPVPGGKCVYNSHITRGANACIFCGKPAPNQKG